MIASNAGWTFGRLARWSSGQANLRAKGQGAPAGSTGGGEHMRPIGRLRWKMPALMLVGTIVIYVDRNVLGVLAPIPKKKSDFTTKQYFNVAALALWAFIGVHQGRPLEQPAR
jgi:hypothetical protein